MNVLGMRYMTLCTIDVNNRFWPVCHAFVFEEEHDLYGFCIDTALEMTPHRAKESIVLAFGDMFFQQDLVRNWLPNVLMMINAFHLMYAKNGQSIMAKDFGPIWNDLKPYFERALKANDKVGFLVSCSICTLFIDCCCLLTSLSFFSEIYRSSISFCRKQPTL